MSSVSKFLFCIFVVLFAWLSKVSAQSTVPGYQIGISGGTLIYQGDLVPGYLGNYKSLKPALGLHVGKSINQYFAVRGNLTFGKIASDESKYTTPAWRQSRNFRFSTPVSEVSAHLMFMPTGQGTEMNPRKIVPYIFAGAGLSFLHIRRNWSNLDTLVYGSKSQVQQGLGYDTVKSLPRAIPVLPVGAGVSFAIAPQWALNAEFTYRFTYADYLDGFKYAGNSNNKDAYYGLSIGLIYRLGNYRYKCPSVR